MLSGFELYPRWVPLLLQLPPRERGTLFQDHGRFQSLYLNIILFKKTKSFSKLTGERCKERTSIAFLRTIISISGHRSGYRHVETTL